jgi:hypothetical protein
MVAPSRKAASILWATAGVLAFIGVAAAIGGLTRARTDPGLLGRRLGALTLGEVVAGVVAAVGLAGFAGSEPRARWARAAFLAAVYLAVNGTAIDREFTPSGNFQEAYGAFYSVNRNQSYGRELAAGIRDGDGLFGESTSDSFPSYRMPGYPVFVAVVGALSGAQASDGLAVDQATIFTQLLLTALALLAVSLALERWFPRVTVLAVGLVLAVLPSFVHRTQVDALVFASGLVITAAILRFLDAERAGAPTTGPAVLVHLAFAGAFALRSDVLLGWCVVSLILHWKHRRLLVLPAVLFLVIGGSYAIAKGRNGHDYGPTTDNLGHVAFVGLWQVPDHGFPWEPLDGSYAGWVEKHGYEYGGKGTNQFATREVVRFYATYPGYTSSLVLHKTLDYFETQAAETGSINPSPGSAVIGFLFRPWLAWSLMVTVLLALGLGYERRRTFLLAWPAFLSLPSFVLLQSSAGRFVTYVTAALVLAGLPLLLDRGFHAAVRAHRRAPMLVIGLLLVLPVAHLLNDVLLDWSWFRFGTPFLDPADSTLVTSASGP